MYHEVSSDVDRAGAVIPRVWCDRTGAVRLSGAHSPEQAMVAETVGYHNVVAGSAGDDVAFIGRLNARCPQGWRVIDARATFYSAPRAGAIRIGQMKFRPGGPAWALYAVPAEGR
jgi:hypothetical protein